MIDNYTGYNFIFTKRREITLCNKWIKERKIVKLWILYLVSYVVHYHVRKYSTSKIESEPTFEGPTVKVT